MSNVTKMFPKDGDDGPILIVDSHTGEILDEDGAATGQTLEDLAEEYVPPFYIKGTQAQLSFDVGKPRGTQVVGSLLKLKSTTLPLIGQYRAGEKVRLVIEVEVEDVGFKAVRSKFTGEIVGFDRTHIASVERATDPDVDE